MARLYSYVWEYRVDPDWIDRFAKAYGPTGVWYDFFRKSAGYIGTDLLADASDPGRFVTIDYFRDPRWRAELVSQNPEEFHRIDEAWERATLEETKIGEFWVDRG